jgi:hypothetical protein
MLMDETKTSVAVVSAVFDVEIFVVVMLALVVVTVLMMHCCFEILPVSLRLLLVSQQLARRPKLNSKQNQWINKDQIPGILQLSILVRYRVAQVHLPD